LTNLAFETAIHHRSNSHNKPEAKMRYTSLLSALSLGVVAVTALPQPVADNAP